MPKPSFACSLPTMLNTTVVRLASVILVSLSGCSSDDVDAERVQLGPIDAAVDRLAPDVSSVDTGIRSDVSVDQGLSDQATPDAGADSTARDAGGAVRDVISSDAPSEASPADGATDGSVPDANVSGSSFAKGRSTFAPSARCTAVPVVGDHQGAMTKADSHTRATVQNGGDAAALEAAPLHAITASLTRKPDAPGKGFIQVVTWVGQNAIDQNWYKEPTAEALSDNSKLPTLGGDVIFVTLSGEVDACCKAFTTKHPAADVNLRLEQVLGMPELPAAKKKAGFIGFWVDPNEVLRPCPNPSTTTTECDAGPIKEPASPQRFITSTAFPTYETAYRWHIANSFKAFQETGYGADGRTKYYPFTGLGYSYDWADTSKQPGGSSEYIVMSGTHYVFEGKDKAFLPTSEFCKSN